MFQNPTRLILLLFLGLLSICAGTAALSLATKVTLNPDDVAWLEKETVRQLQGCRITAKSGIIPYIPNGRSS